MTKTKTSNLEKITNTGSPQSGEPVYLVIGKLQRTHGVKGEVIMDILTDFPERIIAGKQVYIGAQYKKHVISTIRPNNKKLLVSFEGIVDCDQAAILRNQMVFIKTENANELPEGEFYHHEILGMNVFDELEKPLGIVQEILVTGANDVYVITTSDGKEILVPAIKTVVLSIDRATRRMIVRLPEWDSGVRVDPKAYWVGFNLVKGIGAVRLKQILEFFGSLEVAWNSPPEALMAAGLPQKAIDNFIQIRSQVDLDLVISNINKKGIKILTWADQDYPRRLKEINQAPPVLYINGSINVEDDWAVAVVGTRRVTPYGRQVAAEIASYLAQNGVTVVSGLARGVDAIAHQAALQAGGRTIAVLGSGVDVIYPPEHHKLAQEIIRQGAIVSDYPMGTAPDGINFPPRNRIISGLSLATIVVEAGEKSGALITAEFAVDQGRDVFAVPGSILTPQSEGTNKLIEQGARPLLKMSEILEVLKLEQIPEKQLNRKMNPLNDTEKNLLSYLSQEPVHIDEVCNLAGLPINEVSATLTMMELKGMVSQVGGMKYVAAREPKGIYKANGIR